MVFVCIDKQEIRVTMPLNFFNVYYPIIMQEHRPGGVLHLGKVLETYSLTMWCVMVMN